MYTCMYICTSIYVLYVCNVCTHTYIHVVHTCTINRTLSTCTVHVGYCNIDSIPVFSKIAGTRPKYFLKNQCISIRSNYMV